MTTSKIYLKTGGSLQKQVHVCGGAFVVGAPTAFIYRFGRPVWVKPSNIGDGSFVEAHQYRTGKEDACEQSNNG